MVSTHWLFVITLQLACVVVLLGTLGKAQIENAPHHTIYRFFSITLVQGVSVMCINCQLLDFALARLLLLPFLNWDVWPPLFP